MIGQLSKMPAKALLIFSEIERKSLGPLKQFFGYWNSVCSECFLGESVVIEDVEKFNEDGSEPP